MLGALTWPLAAPAQERPPPLPTRDVDVVYRAGSGAQAVEQRWRFQALTQRARLDPPTPGFYAIVDHRAHTMVMVSDATREALQVAAPAGLPGGGGEPGTRRGSATVAGLGCLDWEAAMPGGGALSTCLTPDGVTLRMKAGPQVVAEALRVTYGPLDPALFSAPPGYAREAGRGR